jgi:signal transduction histidine kinase
LAQTGAMVSMAFRRRSGLALQLLGMAGFVAAVYAVVVVGGGGLIGRSGSPSVPLSVCATAIVAVAFDPVRRRVRGAANRLLHGQPIAPYDVLAQFSSGAAATASADAAAVRMARLLAEGTGAARAEVWVVVSGRLRLAGVHPPGARSEANEPDLAQESDLPGRRIRAVRQAGELLGVLVVVEGAAEPLTPVEQKLLTDLVAQAGLVLRNLQLTTDLQDRLREASRRAELLRESRRRVVTLEDEERRRLERDIHDGAQQQLVALGLRLQLARTVLSRSPERVRPLIGDIQVCVEQATTALLGVAAGSRPRLLDEAGLVAALQAVSDAGPVPVRVLGDSVRRYPADVEVALFYFCLEALQNVAKHAEATGAVVRLEAHDAILTCSVADDGHGFRSGDDLLGTGLRNMAERVDAAGGRLTVESSPGRGTTVTATVPVAERDAAR